LVCEIPTFWRDAQPPSSGQKGTFLNRKAGCSSERLVLIYQIIRRYIIEGVKAMMIASGMMMTKTVLTTSRVIDAFFACLRTLHTLGIVHTTGQKLRGEGGNAYTWNPHFAKPRLVRH
jgi:hypothetical protein